jgi:apolipoprotein N-acyltransferase
LPGIGSKARGTELEAAVERVIVTQVPTQGVFTLYSVIGDSFAWLCIAGIVALIAWGLVLGRRAGRAPTG